MRPVLALLMVPLAGCSLLLGIDDPSTGGGPGSDAGDAGVDAMTNPNGDHVELSIGDFRLAKQQMVRLHVMLVHEDGTKLDVTSMAGLSLTSSDTSIATIDTTHPGTIIGAATGSSTIRASFAGAGATIKATVTAIQCHPVINELTTGSDAGGGLDEFIEVYNPCAGAALPVDGWTLDYRAKSSIATDPDNSLLATLSGTMQSGELRVYAGSSYTGTGAATAVTPLWASGLASDIGSVGLRSGPKTTGTLVDSVGYGTLTDNPFVETATMPGMSNGKSASRAPFDGNDGGADDAHDGNNAMNFVILTKPTPGVLNAP